MKISMNEDKGALIYILLGTFLAMVPACLIRFKDTVYMPIYYTLTTYPGDLWNFFTNYLQKGLAYPPEYPAGLRFFYEIMGFRNYDSYTTFFLVNAIILAAFAMATTYVLYLILKERAAASGKTIDWSKFWYFWILSPSFIFYTTVNYDLPVIFLIVLSVYLFMRNKFYPAVFFLALGTVIKVFPAFLLPALIWRAPRSHRLKMIGLFALVVVLLNLPYAISDFGAWIYPYTWQISSNITTGPDQGTYWWIIYPLTGKLTGWLSLGIFGALYLFSLFKMKNRHFIDLCLAVIILFLLTDRIYSPQYNLYLLPFLVLAIYAVNKKLFYVADISNFLVLLFCFFLKDNPTYLQILIFIRYAALVFMLVLHWKAGSSSKYSDGTYASYTAQRQLG